MDDKFRSRKWNLSVASLALASLFLGLNMLTGGEWVTITIFILGL